MSSYSAGSMLKDGHAPQDVLSSRTGLRGPQEAEQQNSGYIKALQEQHRQYENVLVCQRKQHMDPIHSLAEQARKTFLQNLQKQVEEQKIALEQQHSEQMPPLDQQLLQECAELRQQVLDEEGMRMTVQIQKEESEVEKTFWHWPAALQAAPSTEHGTTVHSSCAKPPVVMAGPALQQAAYRSCSRRLPVQHVLRCTQN
mmetsp:Transcript_77473/g.141708  ORF Transcript_77473/g.141708 Transcript_77473/m.141708 type:complete len:199 (-) Transcript_77473:75-671(-)